MTEKDCAYFFGMSKMTVVNENEDLKKYDYVVFVEFIEMIARAAEYKFKGTELESLSLATKIEYLLDEMLPCFKLTRKDVNIEVEEID